MLLVAGEAIAGAPHLRATRTTVEITPDGRLDEEGWSAAPAGDNFWQRAPDEGAPHAVKTEFRVLYDDTMVYVGVRAYDAAPGEIRSLLTRRDAESASDWIVIGFDSYLDRRTAFVFGVNPAGVQRDFLVFNDSQDDWSWDAVWQAGVSRDGQGWVAEFAIPFSQLRFPSKAEQTWGMQVLRIVGRTNEEFVWAPWSRSTEQIVSRFGTVEGLDDVPLRRRIELLPFLLSGVRLSAQASEDPFHSDAEGQFGFGIDAKYGLSSNFTLSAAINPDFGQVEADPSSVNLTAKETFLPEKRPFFLEGTEIFQFRMANGGDGSEQLFYTRRIGAPPHGFLDGDYVDGPDATTIYGAAKLSGRTEGGWSLGLLDAVTAEEFGREAVGGLERERIVEPLTNYAVVRARRDANEGRTNMGAIVTSVHRALEGSGLEASLHDAAYAAALELAHASKGKALEAELKLTGSWVHGSEEVIAATQRAAQRYYQRPDASHLRYDPTRTSLGGLGMAWIVAYVISDEWRTATGGEVRTPGLEVNDLGFQQNADMWMHWLWGQYRNDRPGKVFNGYQVNAEAWWVSNLEPKLVSLGGSVNANATFKNFWSIGGGAGVESNRWDHGALRGGPALRSNEVQRGSLNLGSDGRRRLGGGLGAGAWRMPVSSSRGFDVSPSLRLQAASNLELNLGVLVSKGFDDSQYVQEVVDSDGASRFVFARIEQVLTAMTLRANYTASPTLSLQLYAQPFLASGAYRRFKEAAETTARAYDDRFSRFRASELSTLDGSIEVDRDGDGLVDFSFARPDFSFGQFRSNVVLRWEYLPGSAAFLIWSHNRSSLSSEGQFQLGHEVGQLADEPGEHVVLLKASYWLGL